MEYKLNKIDTDIRQRIEDSTKEGLVHRKQEIEINKDSNKHSKRENFSDELKKHSKKNAQKSKRLFIQAEKIDEVKVEGYINEDEKNNFSSGRFLDIKR
ncbi:hypothetical protein [Clostridium lundense]|uniref:hypothetical protein n=1 Tax=Clostridium lundense TaxID=319475 RepID=UPI000489A7E3|nr:hypothetical protein [Clostridium lundense]